MYDFVILGGGAAGFFAALQAKEKNKFAKVALFEKNTSVLTKLLESGGGRCNLTHALFDPLRLVKNYPRGEKELIGPFSRFTPRDTIEWFEEREILLKIEEDGRVFPVSDSSETIANCLLEEAKKLGVELHFKQKVKKILHDNDLFSLTLEDKTITSKRLLLATGSGKQGYSLAKSLGHTIQKPIPSLFSFRVKNPLKDFSGLTLDAKLTIGPYQQTGPLLITHLGFSGPAVLDLSALAAKHLFEKDYQEELLINWLPYLTEEEIFQKLTKKTTNPFRLPKNLWDCFQKAHLGTSHKILRSLAKKLHEDRYFLDGRGEHIATSGGITLNEVHFKTMESKLCKNLFFAGEILDIDGLTGGFNLQNAWTTGFLAGTSALS